MKERDSAWFHAFTILSLLLPAQLDNCPTMGMSAYILVTISSGLDYEGFVALLTFYSKLVPDHESIRYKFNFGTNRSATIETANLEQEIQSWIDDQEQMEAFWKSARTNSSDFIQFDNPEAPLCAVIRSFSDIIANDNEHPATVAQKKQVVLMTDYLPVNVTAAMNTSTNENEQKLALVHELNVSEFTRFVNFPVYSATEDINMEEAKQAFQNALEFGDIPRKTELARLSFHDGI
ncbi:unnamed protein product [Cylicocyclus nassatus]|uniref:Uncharacterized protein n=1 Tax=Cylicocyclus nassatus TaxID=53992 RepID=A0AA36H2E9_CYLNA|nr:unnamed protein product [Cylicocyclus nassatus]